MIKPTFSIGCLLSLTMANAVAAPQPDWRGIYLGSTIGGAFAHFNQKTQTQAGSVLDVTQADVINGAGQQSLRPNGFVTGVEGGYNWQYKQWVFGLEGDVQSLSVDATTNSGALKPPGFGQYVLTSYGNNIWLFTARPRIGWLTNYGLVYATGGLAVTWLESDFLFSTDFGGFESKRVRQWKSGYVVGAGVETGLTDHVSMKFEYLLTKYGKTNAADMNEQLPPGQRFQNSVQLNENIFRVGFSYHLNNTALAVQLLPLFLRADQWQVELGARPFFSNGQIGGPNPFLNDPGILASRLTYRNLHATALETYLRLDHVSGFFVKGLLGSGNINTGQLHDEDFPAGNAYSNTLSQASGNLSYVTTDAGYSLFKSATAKSGFFAGYNYYVQNVNVYGCRQLAGAEVCEDNTLGRFLAISEGETYQAMRIGLTSQFDLNDRVSLTTEAAYLPIVKFQGLDSHNARQLLGPENSSAGNGSMLETVLTYQFSDSWNMGLGARYWMWNMHSGVAGFDLMGDPAAYTMLPSRFNTYRYGVFFQLTYHEKAFDHFNWLADAPVSWRGLYVGASLGGAWAYTDWTDPFAATPGEVPPRMNMPGFGDSIYANGPLANIDAHYYWQQNRLVLGVGGTAGVADIRGENTLFSGLGGVNGQTSIARFYTVVGKIGTTYHRSLFYLNVGPALLTTQYRINANTSFMLLGSQSRSQSRWGGLLGGGIDYALNDRWTTNVEYDYVRLHRSSITFPAIATIDAQSYRIKQDLSVFKLGLNYKIY